jgi:hypothetical protein
VKHYTIQFTAPITATLIRETRRGRIARLQRDARARRRMAGVLVPPVEPERPRRAEAN